MSRPVALLDSNVIIAAVVERHQHHPASAAVLAEMERVRFAVAGRSYAETYATLTRRGGPHAFGVAPAMALAAVERVAAKTTLVGLSPAEVVEAVRSFAAHDRSGPLLYDHLIGQAAVRCGVSTIVTWNIKNLTRLAPSLRVVTPRGFLVGLPPP